MLGLANYALSDFLHAGNQYTIELVSTGIPGSGIPDSDLASAMQAVPQFGGSAVVRSGLFSDGISITFTLSRDEFVSTLQAEVLGIIAELYPFSSINWLQLHDGGPDNPYGGGSQNPVLAAVPLWVWVAVGVGAVLLVQR